MKTNATRFDDTLNYIHSRVDSGLAIHIQETIRSGHVSARSLGGDLSLGARSDSKADDDYDDHTSQRLALRALLLCQRIYFSKLWAETERAAAGGATPAFVKGDQYPRATPTWSATKAASLAIWRDRSEPEIVEGIKVFTAPAARALDVAKAAREPGDEGLGLPQLGLTRGTSPFPGHGTCYSAVMFWMFRGGVVSYRWMMKHGRGSLDVPGLKRAFGRGTIIWPADRPFGEGDRLPAVPHGHIVHLYVDNAMQWKGHWLVSCGDGTAFGRNNDDEDGRANRIYDRCSLDRQFMAYKESITGQNGLPFVLKGVAEVFDPMQIPDRL